MVGWLDLPLQLHQFRTPMHSCHLTAEQCEFQKSYWLWWYEADRRYGLPTVALILALIGVFTFGNLLAQSGSTSSKHSPALWRRAVSYSRYASYKTFRIRVLGWWSPPLVTLLIGGVGFVFFAAMTLGPKPYWWPNTDEVSYGESPPIATRSGWLALVPLPFMLALAAKANLISAVTGISHEKLLVFHRWLGYAMFILGLLHTFPFIVTARASGNLRANWDNEIFYWTGTIVLLAQAWLTFGSIGVLRNRFYEIFKAGHYTATIVYVVFLFLHCDMILSSWDYFIAAGCIYFACFFYAQFRSWFGYGVQVAQISSTSPGGLVDVRIPISPLSVAGKVFPVGLNWAPAQHMFVRFHGTGIHSLSSHPFTVCSLPPKVVGEDAELRLLLSPRGGLTGRLASLAQGKGGKFKVSLDGPYGGWNGPAMDTFDDTLVVCGGSGAGFSLPVIEAALRERFYAMHDAPEKHALGSQRLHIVLASRTAALASWYEEEIRALQTTYAHVAMDVKLHLHVTREAPLVADEKAFLETPCLSKGLPLDMPSTPSDEDAIVEAPKTGCCSKKSAAPIPEPVPEKSSCCSTKAPAPAPEPEKPTSSCCKTSKPAAAFQFSVEQVEGRPDLPSIVRSLAEVPGASVAVAVCGPSEMNFDVVNAAADAQKVVASGKGAKSVYLHSESFS